MSSPRTDPRDVATVAEREAAGRPYLVVEVPGAAGSGVVAELFDRAAEVLRSNGELTVHHVVFESTDRVADATTVLTVYYERVERRRTHRY